MTDRDPLAYLLRVTLVAVGYTLTTVGTRAILSVLGVLPRPTGAGSPTELVVAGALIGAILGPLAARTPGTRRWHLIMWSAAIALTMAGVQLEGAFFAPDLAPLSDLGGGLLAVSVIAVTTAGLVTLLFVPPGLDARVSTLDRPWWSWSLRILAGAVLYVVLFFIVGSLNYTFITRPFYETHAVGLITPPLDVVFALELFRGVLLVLAVVPFVQSYEGPPHVRQAAAAGILFLFAGVIPLVFHVDTLPGFLLATSSYEILLQVGPTGVLVATLLAPTPDPADDRW